MIVRIITAEPKDINEDEIFSALEALGYFVDAVEVERADEIGTF